MYDNLSSPASPLTEEVAAALLLSLLHKEGSWVDWGQKCLQLQKAGYGADHIFEETGFQKVQQNLVIVAAQVYESLVRTGVEEAVLNYYLGPKSDVLYELRILKQEERGLVAIAAHNHQLDAEGAKELARAFQDLARLSQLPREFTAHPGDALAYQCWKLARQNKDLSARTRLIAKGLKFAHSASARTAIEQLLMDLTLTPNQKAPLVPLYRVEQDEELPRLLPVAGTWPVSGEQINAVAALVTLDPFGVVSYEGCGSLVAIPGWQMVIKAADPIVLFCPSAEVAESLANIRETVLVVIDRAQRTWNENSYFLLEQAEQTIIQWSATPSDLPILGQVIVVMRPKRILDENNLLEPWQMDD